MNNKTSLSLKWLYFEESKKELRQLRKSVFVEEQRLGEFVLDSPKDETGIHLGLFDGDQLVSAISLFIFNPQEPLLKELHFSPEKGVWIQYSRRAELKAYRSKKLASLLVAHAVKSVCELFQPEGMFAVLMGAHMELKDMYINTYGFHEEKKIDLKEGESWVLSMTDPGVIKNLLLHVRNESLKLSRMHSIQLPDLAHHIDNYPQLSHVHVMEADEENRYLQPLSLEDELPRLSAQARMLFLTQEPVWRQIFNRFPETKALLDLGCGPGVYISNVQKMPEARDIAFTGMDISEAFITFARFSHPRIQWHIGTAYSTSRPENSFDLVHCSFLFIHLLKPYLALKEIFRILKPGGIFFLTDVNDATFAGPELIADLVKMHGEAYDGNREIMCDINYLGEKAGFELLDEINIHVENTGTDTAPDFENKKLRLGKWTMWAMFSFMGQKLEVKEFFDRAEAYYMNHQDTISIEVQSKIFRKPELKN